jgi:hypothetical protein
MIENTFPLVEEIELNPKVIHLEKCYKTPLLLRLQRMRPKDHSPSRIDCTATNTNIVTMDGTGDSPQNADSCDDDDDGDD